MSGTWNSWSSWSAECRDGFQIRTRTCSRRGQCAGSALKQRECGIITICHPVEATRKNIFLMKSENRFFFILHPKASSLFLKSEQLKYRMRHAVMAWQPKKLQLFHFDPKIRGGSPPPPIFSVIYHLLQRCLSNCKT
jgi:hypothetical protein